MEGLEKAKEFAYNLVAEFVYNGHGDPKITAKEITDRVAIGLLEYANQQTMTTITIKNEHGTFSVSGEAITSHEYLRLFIAAMVAASFDYGTIEDAIIEVADRSKE